MAQIKSFTDLSQSKKLVGILPLESADMVYFGIHQGMNGKYYLSGTNTEDDIIPIYKNFCIKVFTKTTKSDVINQLPCWSLAALLSVLPKIGSEEPMIQKLYYASNPTERYICQYSLTNITGEYDNPVDACYEIIMRLHELNLL